MQIDIKNHLDALVEQYNTPEFISKDPIQFPRRFSKLQDIEVTAFLTATISWGNRTMILKSMDKMLSIMCNSPFEYIQNKGYESLKNKNIHRTFFEQDLAYICRGMHYIYERHETLEDIFVKSDSSWDSIHSLRTLLCIANQGINSKHISNPIAGSACKRLHMALRWLIRKDGIVDIGIWNRLSPADLFIPLDTHVARVSREFGLLTRKTNDRKAVEELTTILKNLNPGDPVIYDFALFGLGEDSK